MGEVEPREVSWLWPGRIPSGRITLFAGAPGDGKSFATADFAARVSTGVAWPDGARCPRGSVIMLAGEDDAHDTVRPRLDAHAADVSRVHLLAAVRHRRSDGRDGERPVTLADVAAIESAVRGVADCRLLIVDPIGAFIGGEIDSHRENEVRSVLAGLGTIAERCGVAVLSIAHYRKAAGASADDAVLGSRAFTALARATWHLVRHAADRGRRLFLPGKSNLAHRASGLAFRISGEPARLVWFSVPVRRDGSSRRAYPRRRVGAAGNHCRENLPGITDCERATIACSFALWAKPWGLRGWDIGTVSMGSESTVKKHPSLKLNGQEYVVVLKSEFDRMAERTRPEGVPSLPGPDAAGNYPALEYCRALIARDLVADRLVAGLTQKELAKRAGIRVETLCRIETGKHTPSVSTIEKIDRALKQVEHAKANAKRAVRPVH